MIQTLFPSKFIETAMQAACAEARKWLGATSPNPAVGAAALDADGNILAVAAHQRVGQAHAEAAIIELCRDQNILHRVKTLCVTLEPCNHHGRTPPCTEAIISSGIKQVVIGTRDPNPHVQGGGIERLQQASIEVIVVSDTDIPLPLREGLGEGYKKALYTPHLASPARGEEHLQSAKNNYDSQLAEIHNECRQLVHAFAYHAKTGSPWITMKRAFDETGSMIPPVGQKTFTSQNSLILAHRLRKKADAIITGSGTILADNPVFTVRHVSDFSDKKRYLAILDRRNRVPESYLESAQTNGLTPLIFNDIHNTINQLEAMGVQDILVEAGPALSQSMLDSRLWNMSVTIHKGRKDRIDVEFNPDHPVPFDTVDFNWNYFLPAF